MSSEILVKDEIDPNTIVYEELEKLIHISCLNVSILNKILFRMISFTVKLTNA